MKFNELAQFIRNETMTQWYNQQTYTFQKGELIVSPGEKVIYVIVEGVAQIFQLHPDGKECIIDLVDEGKCLGIIEMFSKREHQRFVRALTQVKVISLPIVELKQIIAQTPKLAFHLLQHVSERLEETFEILEQVAYGKVEERLLFALKKLTASDEAHTAQYDPIPSYLKHRDLAGMIGSTRETVTFIMNKLIHEGIIIERDNRLWLKKV